MHCSIMEVPLKYLWLYRAQCPSCQARELHGRLCALNTKKEKKNRKQPNTLTSNALIDHSHELYELNSVQNMFDPNETRFTRSLDIKTLNTNLYTINYHHRNYYSQQLPLLLLLLLLLFAFEPQTIYWIFISIWMLFR